MPKIIWKIIRSHLETHYFFLWNVTDAASFQADWANIQIWKAYYARFEGSTKLCLAVPGFLKIIFNVGDDKRDHVHKITLGSCSSGKAESKVWRKLRKRQKEKTSIIHQFLVEMHIKGTPGYKIMTHSSWGLSYEEHRGDFFFLWLQIFKLIISVFMF